MKVQVLSKEIKQFKNGNIVNSVRVLGQVNEYGKIAYATYDLSLSDEDYNLVKEGVNLDIDIIPNSPKGFVLAKVRK